MKKIAIMTCLKANATCTGNGCMNAFNEKNGHFERYSGEDVQLAAFMRCSHCYEEIDPLEDEGFIKKLNRMITQDIDALHIGLCCVKDGVHCSGMQKMADEYAEKGIEVVWGTH